MAFTPTPPDQIPSVDALLGLLADNERGGITAADLREIVSALASVSISLEKRVAELEAAKA